MTSAFAFSGIPTDPNTKTHPPWDVVSEQCVFGQRKRRIRVDSRPKCTRLMRYHQIVCVDGAPPTLLLQGDPGAHGPAYGGAQHPQRQVLQRGRADGGHEADVPQRTPLQRGGLPGLAAVVVLALVVLVVAVVVVVEMHSVLMPFFYIDRQHRPITIILGGVLVSSLSGI